jgi:hypothetical protein
VAVMVQGNGARKEEKTGQYSGLRKNYEVGCHLLGVEVLPYWTAQS